MHRRGCRRILLRLYVRPRSDLLAAARIELTLHKSHTDAGLGASATFFVTSAVKEAGFGGLLNIGLCYAFGIVFAIIVAAPVSGGHLSPSFTITFAIFKGFPLRKVPYYVSLK